MVTLTFFIDDLLSMSNNEDRSIKFKNISVKELGAANYLLDITINETERLSFVC